MVLRATSSTKLGPDWQCGNCMADAAHLSTNKLLPPVVLQPNNTSNQKEEKKGRAHPPGGQYEGRSCLSHHCEDLRDRQKKQLPRSHHALKGCCICFAVGNLEGFGFFLLNHMCASCSQVPRYTHKQAE